MCNLIVEFSLLLALNYYRFFKKFIKSFTSKQLRNMNALIYVVGIKQWRIICLKHTNAGTFILKF